jgi:hypothetical protein
LGGSLLNTSNEFKKTLVDFQATKVQSQKQINLVEVFVHNYFCLELSYFPKFSVQHLTFCFNAHNFCSLNNMVSIRTT